MVCLPRMYRHRPPEIRGSSVIRKKLLLDRLAVAAHSKPRSCGMKNQRESSDSRSASRHARALIRAARQAPGGVSLSRRKSVAAALAEPRVRRNADAAASVAIARRDRRSEVVSFPPVMNRASKSAYNCNCN